LQLKQLKAGAIAANAATVLAKAALATAKTT